MQKMALKRLAVKPFSASDLGVAMHGTHLRSHTVSKMYGLSYEHVSMLRRPSNQATHTHSGSSSDLDQWKVCLPDW